MLRFCEMKASLPGRGRFTALMAASLAAVQAIPEEPGPMIRTEPREAASLVSFSSPALSPAARPSPSPKTTAPATPSSEHSRITDGTAGSGDAIRTRSIGPSMLASAEYAGRLQNSSPCGVTGNILPAKPPATRLLMSALPIRSLSGHPPTTATAAGLNIFSRLWILIFAKPL